MLVSRLICTAHAQFSTETRKKQDITLLSNFHLSAPERMMCLSQNLMQPDEEYDLLLSTVLCFCRTLEIRNVTHVGKTSRNVYPGLKKPAYIH